jgi:hypothetical protein
MQVLKLGRKSAGAFAGFTIPSGCGLHANI